MHIPRLLVSITSICQRSDEEQPGDVRRSMLRAKLVVVGGAPAGDEFQLLLPTVLGRSREVPIHLPHPLVSRRHCQIMERDGLLFVRDLGSTNGTFVGSRRVQESILADGDLLTIGSVTFRAVYAESSSVPVPVPGVQENDASDTSTLTGLDTGMIETSRSHSAASRPRQKAK